MGGFFVGRLGKNIGNHGWLMVKNFKTTLAKMTVPKNKIRARK